MRSTGGEQCKVHPMPYQLSLLSVCVTCLDTAVLVFIMRVLGRSVSRPFAGSGTKFVRAGGGWRCLRCLPDIVDFAPVGCGHARC